MRTITIKSAKELYEISQESAPKIVADILNGVRTHVIQKSEEEAYNGATSYTIYLKNGLSYVKNLLLDECIKIAKEFEDKGYKVSIGDSGNGFYISFYMEFSWDGSIESSSRSCLYTTDKGIIPKIKGGISK